MKFNDRAILGIGGDVSDMQYIDRMLASLSTDEAYVDTAPETALSAKNLHSYLQKVMYARRSDMNPLWNNILVAGLDDSAVPFLAQVDLYGVAFSAPTLATGFGAHLAQPILRTVAPDNESWKTLDREQAVKALKECMKVLWYRDARSMNQYSLAVVDAKDGVSIEHGVKCEDEKWDYAEQIRGYGTQVA